MAEKNINILDLFDSGSYQTYNREIARALKSVNAAILLSELVNRFKYHRDRDELKTFSEIEGEWFYYTISKCEERTCLSGEEQKTAIKILEKRGFFTKKSKGLPAKRHFRLNVSAIEDFVVFSKKDSRTGKNHKLDRGKPANYTDENPQTIHIRTLEEPLGRTTTTKSDPEQSNDGVVVVSSLEKLKLSEDRKKMLIALNTEDNLKIAVERVLKWKGRENDEVGIMTVLKNFDNWTDTESSEVLQEKNEKFLSGLLDYDMRKIRSIEIRIGKRVDCRYISFSSVVKDEEFKTNDKRFIEKVTEHFREKLFINLNTNA